MASGICVDGGVISGRHIPHILSVRRRSWQPVSAVPHGLGLAMSQVPGVRVRHYPGGNTLRGEAGAKARLGWSQSAGMVSTALS